MKTIHELFGIQAQLNKPSDKESGFFDLKAERHCESPAHNAPKLLHIPQGKGYRHVCPQCGHVQEIIPMQVSF
jgi:hypothetical protein